MSYYIPSKRGIVLAVFCIVFDVYSLLDSLQALEFLKKMSNPGVKEQKSSGVISVDDNELDGVLADEWRLILKEAQQRAASTQLTNENKANNGNQTIVKFVSQSFLSKTGYNLPFKQPQN